MKYNLKDINSLALWLIPKNARLKPITNKEFIWKNTLSKNRSLEYHHSRGYVREVLSEIFNIPALEIPLNAPPGFPPRLPEELGHLSLSHCIDALLIGWSAINIGVDIERSDRSFDAVNIMQNFFSEKEKHFLKNLKGKDLRRGVLSQFVRKEAAIKWNKGNIITDFRKWVLLENNDIIINAYKDIKIYSNFVIYKNWYMSISSYKYFPSGSPVICLY